MIAAALLLTGAAIGYVAMALMVVSGRCARDEELDAEIAEALARWSRRG